MELRGFVVSVMTAVGVMLLLLMTYTLLPFTAYGSLAAGLFLCTREGLIRWVGAGVLVGGVGLLILLLT